MEMLNPGVTQLHRRKKTIAAVRKQLSKMLKTVNIIKIRVLIKERKKAKNKVLKFPSCSESVTDNSNLCIFEGKNISIN